MNSQKQTPEYRVRHGQAAVSANQAATGLIDALEGWSRYGAELPPRLLAHQMEQGLFELHGDATLPEHLAAALDAYEALPEVRMWWRQPDYFDGSAVDFLLDAERVMVNVTGRLDRLEEAARSAHQARWSEET